MGDTKALANRLVRRFGTRDPEKIIKSLDYILIEAPLTGVRGCYQYLHRCHIIYVHNGLNEVDRRWVCAHELGHSFLHKGLNRVFMDACTVMPTGRYEQEADRFAADLLFDDAELIALTEYPIETVAKCLGVSYDIAAYRMRSLKA